MAHKVVTYHDLPAVLEMVREFGGAVQAFGSDGWSVEVDGVQTFRATHMSSGRYEVARVSTDIRSTRQ